MAGALGGDHEHVQVGAGLDQLEMHVQAVGEGQGGALLHVRGQVGIIQLGLQLVGGQDHDHIGPGSGLGGGHDLQALAFGLLDGGRAGAQGDRDVGHAGVAQVQDMGMALRAVADNGNLLGLDQVQIGIAIVIDAHLTHPFDVETAEKPAPKGAGGGQSLS